MDGVTETGERFATDPFGTRHFPVEIKLKRAEKRLEVEFDNGVVYHYPAEFLRVESPSAEVQGHSPEQRQTVPGKRHVAITAVEPVGNYGVRLVFDDGHDTGIYSWKYLYEIGANQAVLWEGYEAELAAKGLSRDPRPEDFLQAHRHGGGGCGGGHGHGGGCG